jgi:hypothetical protein
VKFADVAEKGTALIVDIVRVSQVNKHVVLVPAGGKAGEEGKCFECRNVRLYNVYNV